MKNNIFKNILFLRILCVQVHPREVFQDTQMLWVCIAILQNNIEKLHVTYDIYM